MEKVTIEFQGRDRVVWVAEAWTVFVLEGRLYRRNRYGLFRCRGMWYRKPLDESP